ncbi:hypothetical protein OROMI_000997 [Orobanche minor]
MLKRYFEVRPKFKGSSSGSIIQDPLEAQQSSEPQLVIPSNYANDREKNIELETLIADPGRRKPISDYHPDIQNEVRKAYLKKGPNQPRNFTFPWTKYGDKRRRFNVNWFNKYDWLEDSESSDRAYCLPCYLFKNVSKYGGDHFVGLGFDDWNNPSRMGSHASATNGSHNDCVHMGHDLMNPNQSIVASLVKQTHKKNIDYKVRVGTSLLATKYLLQCGSPFRGHDESEDSPYRGPFLETINLLKESNQDIAKVLNCAPGNNYMTSPVIQKDLAAACAFEITKKIVSDIGDDVFGVLIDESRWGSHFRTLTSLMTLYSPILGVLEEVGDDSSFDRHGEAIFLLDLLQSFDFIFMLYLMVEILGISHDLNVALQRCDQDLLNALKLVNIAKQRLQEMRDDGWEKLLSKVVAICNKHEFDVPDMDAPYVQGKKSRRRASSVSNMHHYKNDCLFSVLDLQLQELNARFDVENTELLYCVACLSPSSSFAAFDEDKLLRMVELYPNDFVEFPEVIVRNQLQNYFKDVRCDPDFFELKGLSDLCRRLVETNRCTTYSVVYKLVKLALILPVATASVERVFSAMNYVKSELCSKMGDQWLNDRLVTFIERDVLKTISNDVILAHFQEMDGKCRRFSL